MKTEKQIVFGRRLRYYRLERELTQEKLGTISGLNLSYIASIERGERNVSLNNIWKLADALEINPVQFFEPVTF
ncbi:MAG: helix-turn-helix transcriptional regulator [Candidatus Sabulitectum sp.]|nr:helix-turn-helix transcriptional regulator [Candidatus Sabulitectum sp.]